MAARKAEPLGAQPHLRDGFLAGNVNDRLVAAGQRRSNLDQQRRFADPGITAEEQDRTTHEAAAGDAVELGEAGGKARGIAGRTRERLEREQPALARHAPGQLRTRGSRTLLADRVPFTAGVAPALPAAIGGTAALADEACFATGHVRNRSCQPCRPVP